MNTKQAKSLLLETSEFSTEILEWIADNNFWSIWVPKSYKGLELSLTEGLKKLQYLAKIDGSLGWTVTLCSGANYFIGNLKPEIANEIFLKSENTVCFGGSGGVFGTAEQQGDTFIISGEWHYATGAPYLTHFTLNAKITVDNTPILNDDGTPLIYSFVIPKEAVQIIENWDTMGLKATATYSFKVNAYLTSSNNAFVYNTSYLSHPIFKTPFSVFADLTLWVNYLGMAEHYLKDASAFLEDKQTKSLTSTLSKTNLQLFEFAKQIEVLTTKNEQINKDYIDKIHLTAIRSVKAISKEIINIHPLLGVKASKEQHPINRVFRDYFTATQHHIFHENRT